MSHFRTVLVQLPLVRESSGECLRAPADVYRVCEDIANLAQEAFTVLALDVKYRLINRHLITLGLADASLVHPREVFRTAIAVDGAVALLLAHNHPSGDPTPSAEDLRITRQLVQAGKIIDIKVLDHVIIGRPRDGRPGFVSLRDAGLVEFT